MPANNLHPPEFDPLKLVALGFDDFVKHLVEIKPGIQDVALTLS